MIPQVVEHYREGKICSQDLNSITLPQFSMATTTKFLIHAQGDQVGVAVEDIKPGENSEGVYMDSGKRISVTSKDPVPLGHKIALVNLKKGDKVIEYGEQIGAVTQDIPVGAHVHVHNIRTQRWA